MEVQPFGNSPASLYTLKNKLGTEVILTDIGASVVRILLKDKSGGIVDIALGYDSPERYFHNDSAYGAIVGRFANRIGGASFLLHGQRYLLDANEGKNVLHGGNDKYFHRLWSAQPDAAGNGVTFHLLSPDGDQGMPGRAQISVRYALDDENRLTLQYRAVSDQDTYFNLTNHCYFNLDGHNAGDVGGQTLLLHCDNFVAIDDAFIPTGEILSVKGTPMDFTQPKPIGRDIDADDAQIRLGNGYDHCFVLNCPSLQKPFATVFSEKTGITMEAFTDLPGVQFYSGNNMGRDTGEKGGKYLFRGGFCLETQFFPDTPNKPQFPCDLFPAGKPFESETVYRFHTQP